MRKTTLAPTSDCCGVNVGHLCDLQTAPTLDLMYLIDSTTSISDNEFQLLMTFLGTSILNVFPTNDTYLGLSLFAENMDVRIDLKEADPIVTFIQNIVRQGKIQNEVERNMDDAFVSLLENIWLNRIDSGKMRKINFYVVKSVCLAKFCILSLDSIVVFNFYELLICCYEIEHRLWFLLRLDYGA